MQRLRVYGSDLQEIENVGESIERIMHNVPGTRSVLFERSMGGLYVDVIPNRELLARYGLQIADVNEVTEAALGRLPVTTTVEGRNRFTVNLRYAQDFRTRLQAIRDVLVPLREGMAKEPAGDDAMGWRSQAPLAHGACPDPAKRDCGRSRRLTPSHDPRRGGTARRLRVRRPRSGPRRWHLRGRARPGAC